MNANCNYDRRVFAIKSEFTDTLPIVIAMTFRFSFLSSQTAKEKEHENVIRAAFDLNFVLFLCFVTLKLRNKKATTKENKTF